jgi:DNA-binding GntR family transcriptional regulator
MSENPVNKLIEQQSTRYQTATEYVVDVLREAIVTGAIKEGEPLGQEELGARFRVSRAPIREALRLLEAQGLVESTPHRGSRVAGLKKDEMVEIFEIRAALEALALRRSIPALSKQTLDAAAQILKEMDAQTNIDRYIELHRRFHLTLYSQAGNRLVTLINQQFDAAERYLRLEVTTLENIKDSQGSHAKLLLACRNGDIKGAVSYVSYVANTGHEVVKSLNKVREQSTGKRRRTGISR